MNFKKVLFGAAAATVAVSGVSLVPFSSAFAADGIPTITAGDSTVPVIQLYQRWMLSTWHHIKETCQSVPTTQ